MTPFNISLFITLGLPDADVAAVRASRVRMPPHPWCYYGNQQAVIPVESSGERGSYFGINFISPTEDLPACIAARLRGAQEHEGFPVESSDSWTTFTLRGEDLVDGALARYSSLMRRWKELSDDLRALLLWHAVARSLRRRDPGRVDSMFSDFVPKDHAIAWLMWAYLDVATHPRLLEADEADTRQKQKRLSRSAGGVLLGLFESEQAHMLRAGPVPPIVEQWLCYTFVTESLSRRMSRTDGDFARRWAGRLFSIVDAMHADGELSQEQAFRAFRTLNVYSNQEPSPADMRAIGIALAKPGGDMADRLLTAQLTNEVRFTAFDDGGDRSERRFCLGHGTDRLLCGSIIVSRIAAMDGDGAGEEEAVYDTSVSVEPTGSGGNALDAFDAFDVFDVFIHVADSDPISNLMDVDMGGRCAPWQTYNSIKTYSDGPLDIRVEFRACICYDDCDD